MTTVEPQHRGRTATGRMTVVAELVDEIEILTAGCLGCGEEVPEDSLSDLFCARIKHTSWCPGPGSPDYQPHMGCDCYPTLKTCQYTAQNRQVDDPGMGAIQYGEWNGYGTEARWWPGIEDDPPELRTSGMSMVPDPPDGAHVLIGREVEQLDGGQVRASYLCRCGNRSVGVHPTSPVFAEGYAQEWHGTHVRALEAAAVFESGMDRVREAINANPEDLSVYREAAERVPTELVEQAGVPEFAFPQRVVLGIDGADLDSPPSVLLGDGTVSWAPSVVDPAAPTVAELDTAIPIGTVNTSRGWIMETTTLHPRTINLILRFNDTHFRQGLDAAVAAMDELIASPVYQQLVEWEQAVRELQAYLPVEHHDEVDRFANDNRWTVDYLGRVADRLCEGETWERITARERALEARRNRNTGPEVRRRGPRRIDPRGTR